MLLATINCFQVPYDVVFTDERKIGIFMILFNGIIDF